MPLKLIKHLPSQAQRAMSLIELLMVLLVLGIVIGITAPQMIGSMRKNQLKEAATQLVTDLNEAKSSSRRYNSNVSIDFIGNGYTINQATPAKNETHHLNSKISLRVLEGGTNLSYLSPYGEAGLAGTLGWIFEVKHQQSGQSLYVKVVGVSGKVILSDSY